MSECLTQPTNLLRDDARIQLLFGPESRVRTPSIRYHFTSISDASSADDLPREAMIALACKICGLVPEAQALAKRNKHQFDSTVGCLEGALADLEAELAKISELDAWREREWAARL